MALNDPVKINESVLTRSATKARSRLEVWDFYSTLRKKEAGPVLEQIIETSEALYGTYIAVLETIGSENLFSQFASERQAKKILNYFSLYVSSSQSLDLLDQSGNGNSLLNIPLDSFEFGIGPLPDYRNSLDNIIKYHVSLFSMGIPARQVQKRFLLSLKDMVQRTVSDSQSYKDVLNTLNNFSLALNTKIFRGFSCRELNDQAAAEEMTFAEETIIGNEDTERELYSLINILGLYDASSQSNVELSGEKPLIVLLHGRPGTGKTSLVKNCAYRLKVLAEAKHLPFHMITFDNTYKDAYHGVDVKNLKARFDQLKDPQSFNLGVVDDAEGVWQSRFSWDASHIEGQSLNEVLAQLDGLKTQYRGNYLLIFTTNAQEKFDPALLNRMTLKLGVRGPTQEDHYVRILQNQMGGRLRYVQCSDQEWQEIGSLCKESALSGRDLNKVASIVKNYITNAEGITLDIQQLSGQEQEQALANLRRPVSYSALVQLLHDRYKSNVGDAETQRRNEINHRYLQLKTDFESKILLAKELFASEHKAQGLNGSQIDQEITNYRENLTKQLLYGTAEDSITH